MRPDGIIRVPVKALLGKISTTPSGDSGPSGTQPVKTLSFSGRDWASRSIGLAGPGPCNWTPQNAWVDHDGLHLKISISDDNWYTSEVWTTEQLGYGTYEWRVIGRIDQLDKNIVFGMFNYEGPDGANEIDIEFSKWGDASDDIGNYTVYPAKVGANPGRKDFAVRLDGTYTTHRFTWEPNGVTFEMFGGHSTAKSNRMKIWTLPPLRKSIPQRPMHLFINLWLFKGVPPSDGKEQEIVISDFRYVPKQA